MAEDMELNVKLAMESQGFQQQITIINREMKVVQAEFANASSALGDFGDEEQKLEGKSASLTQQIALSQQKVDLLRDAHEKAKQTLAKNVATNEELRKSVEKATNAYNQSAEATGETSAESIRLKAELDALNAKYTQSNTLILRNSTTVDNLNIRLQNTQAIQNKLQNELTQTNKDLDKQRNGMDDVGDGAEENGSKLGEFGEKMKAMGKAVAVGVATASAAFVGMAGLGVTMSDDLQKALNKLQMETGATDESMGGLKKSIVDIYSGNSGEGFEDIAKSMSEIKTQTSATGDELESLTKTALLMRDSFGMEVGDSIKTVNQLMKQFGISGTEAYNLIAQGAQKGMNKNGDLLDVIEEYSVKFAGLGLSAEEMFNSLSNGAKAGGWSIDVMGDAMKEFAISTSGPNLAAASEVFQSMGLDADKLADGFTKGGAAAKVAFQEVIQWLGNMKDPVAQNTAGVALFGR